MFGGESFRRRRRDVARKDQDRVFGTKIIMVEIYNVGAPYRFQTFGRPASRVEMNKPPSRTRAQP
jgi:hypothetical protein